MRFWLFFFSLLFSFYLPAQSPEAALQKFADNNPQEKVVVLFSKPEYLAGETVYFKTYVLSGYAPSLLSTNLYAELYDKDKHLLQKTLIPLVQGCGNGQFRLPATLAEDVYYIRAYTQWMRNFDEALFHRQPLLVYNFNSSQSLRPKPVQWKAHAFIESGQLLNDAPANVAVRLTATGSLPTQWSGEVLEEGTTEPLAPLTVYNNEIGQVRFIAQAGKTYRIVVKDNAGNREELILPPVQKSGILLQTAVSAGKLLYQIQFKDMPSAGTGYKLLVAYNNEPAVTAAVNKSPGFVNGSFDLRQLPAGVVQLTIFNEKNEPALERLLFLHQDSLSLATLRVRTDTLSFAPKGYNHWQVSGDSIVTETAGVVVADALLWQPPPFLGAVYLASDFADPVDNADWYFTDVTPEKKAALDALLLTEKWRRYQWRDLLQNRSPAIRFPPDAYLQFTGTVSRGNKPQPLRDMNLILRAADSSFSFVQVKTDSAGTFALNNFFFTDSVAVYYQANKRKLLESDPQITFIAGNQFAPFSGAWPHSSLTAGPRSKSDSIPVAVQKAAAQRASEQLLAEKIKMLEEVVVTTKARSATEELEKKLTSGLFSGGNADVFDFVNQNQNTIAGFTNILEWLQGRVPGLTFTVSGVDRIPLIRNSPVQLFLDEMLATPDLIGSLSPFDVALIKVYRSNFVGSLGTGSAIAIYTRRGGMPTQGSSPSLPSAILKGYPKFTPPVMPDYTVPQAKGVTDTRTVLFYNSSPSASPAINTLSIPFYNNDSSRQFRLLVTGFTPDGRLVYLNRLVENGIK